MDTICIYNGNSHQDALIVKEILESNDIITIMPNEHLTHAVPYFSVATGGYVLYVGAYQFMEAARLLNSLNIEIQNSHLVDDLEELQKEKDLTECPHCGNKAVETMMQNRTGLIFALFALTGVPVNARKVKKICRFCGEKL